MPRPFVAALFVCVLTATVSADDWPQWLGPERDGVWREAGVTTKLPAETKPVWEAKVSSGYAGPAVAEGRVYLLDRVVPDRSLVPADPFQRGRIPGSERVLCFDD
ncbi:MAG TPA: pyrrolo-quinoline quinone, partial [Planctomycetaceae bacterium]